MRFRLSALDAEISSRPAAVLRIGLAVLAGIRFAGELTPWSDPRPAHIAVNTLFFAATTASAVGLVTPLATILQASVLTWLYASAFPEHPERSGPDVGLLVSLAWLVAVSPSGRSFSLDRRWALSRGAADSESAPAWPLWLVRALITTVYLGWISSSYAFSAAPGVQLGQWLAHDVFGLGFVQTPGVQQAVFAGALALSAAELALALGPWLKPHTGWVFAAWGFHLALFGLTPASTLGATLMLAWVVWLDPAVWRRETEAAS